MTPPPAVTLRDVALCAGVHTATASRALDSSQAYLVNAATRARVRTCAEELGYQGNAIARSLRKGSSGTLGIVAVDLSNPFVVPLLRGIERESRAGDYVPIIAETHDDHDLLTETIERMLRHRVDAVIMSAAHLDLEKAVTELERHVPVVLAVRGYSGFPATSPHYEVVHDDAQGARMAVSHLAELGHRTVAEVPANVKEIASFASRSAGFRRGIASAGLRDVSTGAYALEPSLAEGRRLATDLLRLPVADRPTAVFAHNDLMAVGVIDALREAGLRCPEDISVVGYNDAPLSDHLDPALTTIQLPGFELGRHAARMAIALSKGEEPAQRVISLPATFVRRGSTSAPRHAAKGTAVPLETNDSEKG